MVRTSIYFNPGAGSVPGMLTVATGALTAGDNTITHGLDLDNIVFQLRNSTNIVNVNQIYPDPADPKNKVIINVAIDIAGGLDLYVIGYS